jgi:5,5'-dehydrodivanillate O-demethylase
VLSEEQNRKLVEVSAGTPMGELLRRYWMPIGAVTELEDSSVKPVRLMGEDLVLFRDRTGHYGLLDRHCAHRRADLSHGWVEDRGLRCHYHGWVWEGSGRCVQQPFEECARPEARFKDRVRIKAYPVEPKAGLLWAYLGPAPAPLVPTWEPFTWDNGFVQIVFAEIPCNWFQCQENSIDPVHFEWLHGNWSRALSGGGARSRRRISGSRSTSSSTGSPIGAFSKANRIPCWSGPITDPLTGRWIAHHRARSFRQGLSPGRHRPATGGHARPCAGP